MNNLNIPDIQHIEFYDSVLNHKNGDRKLRLQAIRNIVEQRYIEYQQNTEELSIIAEVSTFNSDQKDDLMSCYGNNKEFNKVRSYIGKLQTPAMQSVCPYCGIGEPNTLDHYLPKEMFPEFSILAINLVPCCSICNNEKGSVWLTGGVRSILNYYFDNVPSTKFLYTTIIFPEGLNTPTVSFALSRSPEINTQLFKTITVHFAELKLLERYEKKVNDEVSGIFYEVTSAAEELTVEEQKRNLRRSLQSLKLRYGENYWKASLLDAIISSDQFFIKCYKLD